MRRFHYFLFFFYLVLFPVSRTKAQPYDYSQLPIVVRNVPEWCSDYPTVINNWNGMFIRSIEGTLPPVLSVVTSINGNSTKGMTIEHFNSLLMSRTSSNIQYSIKEEGNNKIKNCIIKYYKNIYWPEGITMDVPEKFNPNISIKNIKNSSVFNYSTFAYLIGSLTEIDEENVLKEVEKGLNSFGFIRSDDTSKADMIITLSKGRDEYNGYSYTLTLLDGKRLNEGIERAIWTLNISNINNDNVERILKESIFKSILNFPFDQPAYSTSIETLGVAFDSKETVKSGRILHVLKGTDAYNKGLRGGDLITKAYAGARYGSPLWSKLRRYYFKPNRDDGDKNWGVDLLLFFPIIPQFTYNNATTYLSDSKRRGGSGSGNHFNVRKSSGYSIIMDAPFQMSTLLFKYIR